MEDSSEWFKRVEYSWVQRFVIKCIKAGVVPKHLSFIMDGNRRFAKTSNITRLSSYKQGFNKIGEILDYCEAVGVTTVSVYAFSIENFKRSEEEKNELISLMAEKIGNLMKELDQINEKGIRIHVMGNISLFPLHLQQSLAKIILATMENTNFCLNLCLSYTSREEMTNSVKCLAEGVATGSLEILDINENVFNKCLYSEDQPPVDMLIRTSGEVRLSDYMMWQANFSVLKFIKVMWPEFGFWHFIGAVLEYQRQEYFTRIYQSKYNVFCRKLAKSENEAISHMTECSESDHSNCHINQSNVEEYTCERNRRTNAFLSELKQKRRQFLIEKSQISL